MCSFCVCEVYHRLANCPQRSVSAFLKSTAYMVVTGAALVVQSGSFGLGWLLVWVIPEACQPSDLYLPRRLQAYRFGATGIKTGRLRRGYASLDTGAKPVPGGQPVGVDWT